MKTLLLSKKFWLCISAIVAMVVMLATKQIGADQFTEGFAAVVCALMVAMGIQDAAPNVTNVTHAPITPAEAGKVLNAIANAPKDG